MKEDAAEATLTGQDDVVLLSRRKFFMVQASLSEQSTDNAWLADRNLRHSTIGSYSLVASASTLLGERVDVAASAGIFGSRYAIDKTLDYDGALASLSAITNVRGFSLSLDYSLQTLREGGFGREQLKQSRLGGAVAYPLVFGKGRLRFTPTLSADSAWANPTAYNSQSVGVDLPLTYAVSDRLFLSVKAGAARRFYPDYFPGLLGLRRKDDQVSWQLSAVRLLPHNLAIRAEITGVANFSTSDVNRYRSTTGVFGISLQKAF